MAPDKSLDEIELIATLLRDVSSTHVEVFSNVALRKTQRWVKRRAVSEGLSFLTKTLPRLGKALDKALCEEAPLNAVDLRFPPQKDSNLPRFLGEFFNKILRPNGYVLEDPCVHCVKVVRQICYLFYKYEVPYSTAQEQEVIDRFIKTEETLSTTDAILEKLLRGVCMTELSLIRKDKDVDPEISQIGRLVYVIREARSLLYRLFESFDPTDIMPRHGPGAVATRQKLWDKFNWTNVSKRITALYPFDEYFCSSMGHVCDTYHAFTCVMDDDLPARVILVPKDSRGPRLISCEPVDFQWIQQGLGKAIVDLVESHYLTRDNVRFTDQQPNQFGAVLGSITGEYATLDLNEASDRVSVDLVHLLFPSKVLPYLEAARSVATELPDGSIIKLRNYAPMGSCLCFPIMALTIWAILAAATQNADARESIYVYGDDVIVPTAQAGDAIELLESFGLKVNRDKSCIKGLFRESCGVDAFKGTIVTPIRLRTVWSSKPSPDVYTSWIAYANSFYDRGYFSTYEYIVGALCSIYGTIPSDDMGLPCPSLREYAEVRPLRTRFNANLQKRQYRVWDVRSPVVLHESEGWQMLLRFFTESKSAAGSEPTVTGIPWFLRIKAPFRVGSYTQRHTSKLVRSWR